MKKGFEYQYFIKDHLGNTRVVLTQTNPNSYREVLQQNSYYPFGMLMAGLPQKDEVNTNKYLYNGKELQTDFGLDWYDYGARFYDAEVGRFHTVDPLCEWHFKYTNYNYCFNNPIRFIDPIGMDTTLPTTPDPVDPKKRIPIANLDEVQIKPKPDKKPDKVYYGFFFVVKPDIGVNNDSRKGDGEKIDITIFFDVFDNKYIKNLMLVKITKWLLGLMDSYDEKQPKLTPDKKIIEKHTGTAEKRDGNLRPMGKYNNWIIDNSLGLGVVSFSDPSGDSVLIINRADGDSVLLAPFQKLKGHVVTRQKINLNQKL